MKKVPIAHISRAGHTQQMADDIAEGVRMVGREAELQTASALTTARDLAGDDGAISARPPITTPCLLSRSHFSLSFSRPGFAGKSGGAFGSYTHSGDAPLHIFDTMEQVFKMAMTSLGPFKLLEHLVDTPDGMRAS